VFGDVLEVVPVIEAGGREHAAEQLQTAQAVYLGGGRTELLLSLFEKWNLVDDLKQLLDRGGIVAGISAGAQALSAAYADFEERATMETKRGWDFAPVYCLVHAKEDQIEKTLDTYRASGESATLSFVAVGERAAWHIHDGTAEKIGEGPVWNVPAGTLDNGATVL
jgi:peptidase E